MTLSIKDHRTRYSLKMARFVKKKKKSKLDNRVVLYLAVRYGCEHTHTSEREPYVPYVVGTQGVHTHTAREETLRAVRRGCWVTHTFSRSRIVFLLTALRGCGDTHTTTNSMREKKRLWVWVQPRRTARGVDYMKTLGVWTPTSTPCKFQDNIRRTLNLEIFICFVGFPTH